MGSFLEKMKNDIKRTAKYFFSKNFLIDKYLIVALFISIQVNDLLVRFLTIGLNLYFRPFLSNILVVGLFLLGVVFIPKKHQAKVIWIYIYFSSILAMANFAYYGYFGRFLTLGQIHQAAQLSDVKESIFQVLSWEMLLFFVTPLVLYFFYRKIKNKIDLAPIHNRKGGVIAITFSLVLSLLINVSLLTGADVSRISKLWNRELVVGTFGIYTYQFSDAYKVISSKYFVDVASAEVAEEAFDNFYTEEQMTQITDENTGIFEGRDVYYIHYESAQNFLVNETINGQEVTPTFNRLIKEGVYFNGIQSQESYGTSSDSEFTISTSLLPLVDGTLFVTESDKTFITTEHLLNNNGYDVYSFHGNDKHFWNREIMLGNMGYDEVYGIEELPHTEEDILGPWGLGDGYFYEVVAEELEQKKLDSPDTPIFAKLITLTNHHTFEPGAELSELDLGSFSGQNSVMDNYVKSYNYVDGELQKFFDTMDEKGLLDNAVVVIYGDHNAPLPAQAYTDFDNYDFENDMMRTKEDEDYITLTSEDVRRYKSVPLLIWTKDGSLKSETISQTGGLIDVGPTVNNLLGIYNPYQLGYNLLHDRPKPVTYPNGSWIDDETYYDASKDTVYGLLLDEEEEQSYTEYANQISDLSRYIVYYDLQKELLTELLTSDE